MQNTTMTETTDVGKLSARMELDSQISQSKFPLKYKIEVEDTCSEIRFKRDLSFFQRTITDESSSNPQQFTSIKRLSIYCRSTDGNWRNAFTKFCNHFRNQSKINLSRIYDVLKIYLQTANCDLNDLQVKLIPHGEIVVLYQAVVTHYRHDIEIWLP